MDDLIYSLKKEIIERLNLEGLKPEDIDENAELFGPDFGLDSIDALELIVMLDKNYKIKIEDPKEGRKVFQTVRTIADYISSHQEKPAHE
jgi:acyl carrier protein